MELPPPPPPVGAVPGGALPPPGAPSAAAVHDDLLADDGAEHRGSGLGGGWRWTLGIGWCIVLGGLGALAQAAYLVDADPWWLRVRPLPFALPVAVLLGVIADSRWTLPLSAGAVAVLGVLTLVDAIVGNPVVAAGEAVCTVSGLLLTLAAALGRVPQDPAGVPGSTG